MIISPQSIRRAAIILGFAILVIALGFLTYVIFFRAVPSSEPGSTATTTPPGILPEPDVGITIPRVEDGAPERFPSAIARGGLTQTNTVVDSPISGVMLRDDGRIVYYDDRENRFFSVSSDGAIVTLSSKTFPQVSQVTWSPDTANAIIEFPDGANIFYDFQTDTQVTLPQHWSGFTFSPDGDQLVFKSLALDPENNVLAVAGPDGSSARIVASLGENAHRVLPDWSPNRQIVASYAEPLDGDRQELFFMGLNDENFKKIVINGYGYQGKWNPNGTQLLYSVSSSATGNSPSLWIVNAQGEAIGSGRRPFSIQTTADKCTFANVTSVYCAVPQFLPDGSGILPSIADGIPDDIYKINVVTGASSKVAELDSLTDIGTVTVSADERYLYFTDSFTGKLKSIRLK